MTVQIAEFSRAEFDEDFPDTGCAQTEYLWAYLGAVKAKSFVREPGYVDRHYLADFTSYHARSFRVPEAHCRRLHFFTLQQSELAELIGRLYTEDAESAEARLNNAYLGFVVRRPLKRAHIGRTVLSTYPPEGRRQFTVLRDYEVHLRGLHLTVKGLAFQQQDVGAAVCASTALWCALQRVARIAGHRTPTPSEVTAASNSPYSASFGLTESQMANALATLGFAADTFVPGSDPASFRAKVAACLRSHLPVILMCNGEHEAHAVTVTGYSEPGEAADVEPFEGAPEAIPMRSGSMHIIYVHDDNLGPHAHFEMLEQPPESLANDCYQHSPHGGLWLLRGRSNEEPEPWWTPDCLIIEGALVPKPSKVRMPVDDLLKLAWSLRHAIELVFEELEPHYEVRFTTGVEYRRQLPRAGLDPSELRRFNETIALPRHLAVVGVYAGDTKLTDLLLDATCVDLDPQYESLFGIVAPGVPAGSIARKRLQAVADEADVCVVGAR